MRWMRSSAPAIFLNLNPLKQGTADSIIERSVCIASFCFSGNGINPILTMITEALLSIIPIGATPLTGYKLPVSLPRTVFKQIQSGFILLSVGRTRLFVVAVSDVHCWMIFGSPKALFPRYWQIWTPLKLVLWHMFGHHWLRYWSFSPPLESIWIFANRMCINRIFKLHTRLEKFNQI